MGQKVVIGKTDAGPEEIYELRRVLSEWGEISPTGNGNDQMRNTIREKYSGEEIAEKRHYSQKRTSFALLCLVCGVVMDNANREAALRRDDLHREPRVGPRPSH